MVGLFHLFFSPLLSLLFSFWSFLPLALWFQLVSPGLREAGDGLPRTSFCSTGRWAAGRGSQLLASFLRLLSLDPPSPVSGFSGPDSQLAANYHGGVSQYRFKVLSLPGGVLFEQVVSGNPKIFKEAIEGITLMVQGVKWDPAQEGALRTTRSPFSVEARCWVWPHGSISQAHPHPHPVSCRPGDPDRWGLLLCALPWGVNGGETHLSLVNARSVGSC